MNINEFMGNIYIQFKYLYNFVVHIICSKYLVEYLCMNKKKIKFCCTQIHKDLFL